MNWSQVICNILINLCSSFLFVGFIGILLWLIYCQELSDARRFFGFKRQTQVYISAHEDKDTVSRAVVTAVEYEAAVELKNTLRDLSGREFIRRIAGLIGQDPKLPEPEIEPSPLDSVNVPVQFESIILIGGPLRNQLTKFYATQQTPLLKFDEGKYLKRVEGQYQEIGDSKINAILVKMILESQVVFFVFGDGEEHTKCAAKYLAENWRELGNRFTGQAFGICLSVTNGKAKKEKIVL